jgi:hypothetical protein
VTDSTDWEACCRRAEEHPEHLDLEARACEALPSSVRSAPARWVEGLLAGRDVPALRLCRRLLIVGRRLSREELVRVASSPHLANLEELRLFDVGLGDDEAEAFAAACTLEKLTAFYAPWNRVGPRGARALVGALRRLKRLHLYCNELGPEGVAALTERPPPLESLNVCLNGLGPAGADVVRNAVQLRHLRTLHIGLNELGDEGFSALARAPHLGALVELNAKSNGAGPAGLEALLMGPAGGSLERLLLEENRVGPAGAEVVARAARSHLTTLQFGGAEVGVGGARALARAPALTQLEHLVLWGNQLTDEGLSALLEAPFLPTLSSLDVSDNVLSPVGHQAVRRLTHLTQLHARP